MQLQTYTHHTRSINIGTSPAITCKQRQYTYKAEI